MKLWEYYNRYYYERGMPDHLHPTFTMHYVHCILMDMKCKTQNCEACAHEKLQWEKGNRVNDHIPRPFRV